MFWDIRRRASFVVAQLAFFRGGLYFTEEGTEVYSEESLFRALVFMLGHVTGLLIGRIAKGSLAQLS